MLESWLSLSLQFQSSVVTKLDYLPSESREGRCVSDSKLLFNKQEYNFSIKPLTLDTVYQIKIIK